MLLVIALAVVAGLVGWRERARARGYTGREFGIAWQLHCLENRIEDASQRVDALERRRDKLVRALEPEQLALPFTPEPA